jgi:hypothetical protein
MTTTSAIPAPSRDAHAKARKEFGSFEIEPEELEYFEQIGSGSFGERFGCSLGGMRESKLVRAVCWLVRHARVLSILRSGNVVRSLRPVC